MKWADDLLKCYEGCGPMKTLRLGGACPQTPAGGRARPPDPLRKAISVGSVTSLRIAV
jgi:hypothetical protein